MKPLIAAIAIVLTGAVLLARQQEQRDEALRVDVRLVNIYATVMDTSGRYVDGLKQTDFIVQEDGRRQMLSHFDHNEDTPVSVGVILDTSGSMNAKLNTATDAIDRFIRTIHPDDDIFLMGFDTETYLLQDFTSDRTKLRKALKYADSGGGTALYDALQEGIKKVKHGGNTKRAILLITDGQDNTSESTFTQARLAVRESELLVYSLGISPSAESPIFNGRGGGGGNRLRSRDSVDMNVLQSFASDSGGRAYLVSENMLGGKNSEFDRILAQIAAELRSQYTLGYYPSHPDDGKYHDIRVQTRYGYYVRARRGYVAGKF
jgi:Ca-activated chloride channel homolog